MSANKSELSGGNVNYYLVEVKDPKRLAPYTAECEDIIEALGMTFSEGCEFKALWRSCAARTLGKRKVGDDEHGVYDADKCVYYAKRTQSVRNRIKSDVLSKQKLKEALNIFINIKEISQTHCIHTFQSLACGYHESVGCIGECDKTLKMCQQLGNSERFCAVQLPKIR